MSMKKKMAPFLAAALLAANALPVMAVDVRPRGCFRYPGVTNAQQSRSHNGGCRCSGNRSGSLWSICFCSQICDFGGLKRMEKGNIIWF